MCILCFVVVVREVFLLYKQFGIDFGCVYRRNMCYVLILNVHLVRMDVLVKFEVVALSTYEQRAQKYCCEKKFGTETALVFCLVNCFFGYCFVSVGVFDFFCYLER